MRSILETLAFTALAIVLAATTVQALPPGGGGSQPRVDVCHVPPGNPANFHTITVSVNAVPAHLNHGDLIGACADNCETLCDDGDPCTIDACDPGTGQCAATHPPVDCDDGNLCTADSCDSATGACVNVANVDCSDDDLCTVDLCDPLTGECENTPAVCGPGESCDPGTGECAGNDVCDNHFCQNGGDCVPNDDGQTYTCECLPGYTGMFCEIDPCAYNQCQNGGLCIRGDSGTTYTCDCPPGYSGSQCEIEDSPAYDCVENDPCDPLAIPDLFYYTHADETMFVQCSEWGQCYEISCPPSLVWNQDALTCVSP